MIERIVIQSLLTGGVYAVLAVGFALIFGVARMINLAHTAFLMLAAYGMFFCSIRVGLDAISSIVLSLVAVSLLGLVTYKLFIDRIREHHATVLLITVAIAIAFQELLLMAFGAHFRSSPTLISGYWEILAVRVSYQHLLTLGIVVVVLVGMWALLSKTKLGIALRATSQDTEVASLMGINVSRVLMITMAMGAALAAVAGIVVAPLWTIHPFMWMPPLIMMMAIVVLGGLGSIKGSFIGAFIIGVIETLVVFLVPQGAYLSQVIALLIMVIILSVRPEGLFGIVFEEERL